MLLEGVPTYGRKSPDPQVVAILDIVLLERSYLWHDVSCQGLIGLNRSAEEMSLPVFVHVQSVFYDVIRYQANLILRRNLAQLVF